MIVALWFTAIGFIFLVGMGLVVMTFRHWFLEARAKRNALAAGLSESQNPQ